MKYPKIQTLYKREESEKGKPAGIIIGDYSEEEFKSIDRWDVTEKIHGTNTRIIYDGKKLEIKGKTDKADIPDFLLENLKKIFTLKKLKKAFPETKTEIILYGEGYGGRIQDIGKKYRRDSSFILFDVKISYWWLDRDKVKEIAKKLDLQVTPSLGIMTKKEIEKFVKSKPNSKISKEELEMEWIVARAHPLMLFRDSTPIMFKLKVNDYRKAGVIKWVKQQNNHQ